MCTHGIMPWQLIQPFPPSNARTHARAAHPQAPPPPQTAISGAQRAKDEAIPSPQPAIARASRGSEAPEADLQRATPPVPPSGRAGPDDPPISVSSATAATAEARSVVSGEAARKPIPIGEALAGEGDGHPDLKAVYDFSEYVRLLARVGVGG